MKASDHIRIEQERLEQIRAAVERRMEDERNEIRDKVEARKEAHREGRLDEDKAAEDWRKNDEPKLDRQKEQARLAADQMRREQQQKADRDKEEDQRKADQQKRDDQQKEDLRAETRLKGKEETERVVKEELKKHGEMRQEKIMAGSSTGPAMTPSMINDPIRMAAAMDHPGLNDDQKLVLHNAGYAVGEGWHNREAQRKQELMQGEREKMEKGKGRDSDRYKTDSPEKSKGVDREEHKDFHSDLHGREKEPEKTPEQKHEEAVQARDDAVSDAKEAARGEHEDQQVGETGKDRKERADLESTGKVTYTEAEEMTHGKGSREKAERQFEEWYNKHEDKVLADQGVSRDPKDYEMEDER